MAAPLPLKHGATTFLSLEDRLRTLKGHRVQIRMSDQLMMDGLVETVADDYLELGNGGYPAIVPFSQILYIQRVRS